MQQVVHDLYQAGHVALDDQWLGGQFAGDALPARIEVKARRFDTAFDDGAQVDLGQPQINLAGRDAANVQQVVDQARQMGNLAIDHVARDRDITPEFVVVGIDCRDGHVGPE